MRAILLWASAVSLSLSACQGPAPSSGSAGGGGAPSAFASRHGRPVAPVRPQMRPFRATESTYTGAQPVPRLAPPGRPPVDNLDAEAWTPVNLHAFDSAQPPSASRTVAYDPGSLRPVRELIYGGRLDEQPGERPYRFGVNDQMTLQVEDHDELSGKVQVFTDGTVELPLVGDRVQAAGRTVEDLEAGIAKDLSDYLKDSPEVKIGVDYAAGQYYYVFGEVQTAGRYAMGVRPITVSEAVFRANSSSILDRDVSGGIIVSRPEVVSVEDRIEAELDTSHRVDYDDLQTGDLRKVYLITPHPSRPTREIINVKSILYEGRTGEDRVLRSGQIVFVPSATDARFIRFVERVLEPLNAARSLDEEGTHWYERLR